MNFFAFRDNGNCDGCVEGIHKRVASAHIAVAHTQQVVVVGLEDHRKTFE